MPSSRGIAISAYIPAFAKGAKIVGDNISAGVVTNVHLKDATVIAGEIGPGAVTSAKLDSKAVVASKMNAAQITGTVISAGITYSVTHGLSAVPSILVITPRSTLALISAGGAGVGEAIASARTSAVFYILTEQHGMGFAAYVQI